MKKWKRNARLGAMIDIGFSLANFLYYCMAKVYLSGNDDEFKDNLSYTAGMIAILIQFVYAGFLASFVANEEIRNCKNWMSVTIVTSIIYDICIFPGLISNHFRELGYFFVVGFTFFKVYELGVVYAFIIEVQRPRIPRPSVTARRLQLAVSQVVSPYAVATTILNTSTNAPTAPPQPQVVLPLPNVVAVDLQPSCPEIQDEPSCIEPLLPYYDEEMSPIETDYVGPQVFGPDFPPPYFETQRQYERTESPPPSYDEAVWSK